MVVYYLAVAMSQNLAFYVDGSEFSRIQVSSHAVAFNQTINQPSNQSGFRVSQLIDIMCLALPANRARACMPAYVLCWKQTMKAVDTKQEVDWHWFWSHGGHVPDTA